jgi:hypothetical protein
MTRLKTKKRVAAICLMLTSAGLYAVQSGALADTPATDASPDLEASAQATVVSAAENTATEPTEFSAFGLPCGLSIDATPAPGAIVALDVMAPCQPDTMITIAHSGLTLAGRTDAFGLLSMDIPAFETPAFFSAEAPDGSVEVTLVPVPDLRDYDRVAVQWQAPAEVELHAMEFGASFGGPGHVWQDAPGQLAEALAERGGFLTRLGDTDGESLHRAQVYSLPRAALRSGDTVRLSVDLAITDGNCGQSVSAHTLQIMENDQVDVTPIELTMPGCDAVGDYLVLQNPLRDLRLASN